MASMMMRGKSAGRVAKGSGMLRWRIQGQSKRDSLSIDLFARPMEDTSYVSRSLLVSYLLALLAQPQLAAGQPYNVYTASVFQIDMLSSVSGFSNR